MQTLRYQQYIVVSVIQHSKSNYTDHELYIVTYKIYGMTLYTQTFSNTKHNLDDVHQTSSITHKISSFN
jgi:hypothetical protein